MLYPHARHGGFGMHYLRLMVDFIHKNLGDHRGETSPLAEKGKAADEAEEMREPEESSNQTRDRGRGRRRVVP
jgi:hypothetical protein